MVETKKSSKGVDTIAEKAKILFWKHGIRRVSVAEICREAGVSKMTFYRNFSNKNDLAEKILKKVMEDSMRRYDKIMRQDIAFSAKILEIIILKREDTQGISQEFLKDIYQSKEDGLRSLMETYRQKSLDKVMQDMAEAQKRGWIRKDLSLPFLLYILKDIQQKIMDEELVAMYDKPEDLIMELTNFFFYGILP